jgi:4-alpha-glucanotransferase
MDALRQRGLLTPEAAGEASNEEDIVLALYTYLTQTPSRLLAVALTDAVGDRRTQNQPGTTNEYPNWRVTLTGPYGTQLLLEDVFADRRAAALCDAIRRAIEPDQK